MASPPEEHAVLTVKLGPWIPYEIAICAAPRFPRIFGRKRGLTLFAVHAVGAFGVCDDRCSAQGSCHDDTDAVSFRFYFDPALFDGFLRRRVSVLNECAGFFGQFARHIVFRIKSLYFSCDGNRHVFVLEAGDAVDAAFLIKDPLPVFFNADANRRHRTKASND